MVKNIKFYETLLDHETVNNYILIHQSEEKNKYDIYIELANLYLPKIISQLKTKHVKAKTSILINHFIYYINHYLFGSAHQDIDEAYLEITNYLKLEKELITEISYLLRQKSQLSKLFLYSNALFHLSNETLKSYLEILTFYSHHPDSNLLLTSSEKIHKGILNIEIISTDVKKLLR